MMRWLRGLGRLPDSLLEPDPLVEVIVTCGRDGRVRCTTNKQMDSASAVQVVSSLFACARAIQIEAQQVAAERGVRIEQTADGNLMVG